MKKESYSAPSVKKAFRILHAVSESTERLGVSDLAKGLGIGKSTVHGITSVLEKMGILNRDPVDKKYGVGFTLLELGRKAYARVELRDLARRPMKTLMERVGETVFLGIIHDDHVTIIDVVESPNELKITSPPGTRLPLLAGAIGKAVLAEWDEQKAKELIQSLGLKRYTSKSIVEPRRFLNEVKEAKRRGCATDDQEYLAGVRAVAAVIRRPSSPLAAVWVVGFTSSLNEKKMQRVVLEVRKTAREISLSSGHSNEQE